MQLSLKQKIKPIQKNNKAELPKYMKEIIEARAASPNDYIDKF